MLVGIWVASTLGLGDMINKAVTNIHVQAYVSTCVFDCFIKTPRLELLDPIVNAWQTF